ncbi:ead/Ea22-like family protein [Enterobacter hormaechei]|uniref:ead/Ea22-like family protein n=1 Tax=Enterobacter hormaechei TaxID=158836 RepID=UPI001F224E6A|nr:ead/Ea22-like family protein [Enterobacter hormaechei]
MSNIDKQALREAAERAESDSWGYDRDEFNEALTPSTVLALLDELEDKDKLVKELKNQVDYLQKIAHEQNELATKASNENASLTVMHGRALKHIDSLEKDLVPVIRSS